MAARAAPHHHHHMKKKETLVFEQPRGELQFGTKITCQEKLADANKRPVRSIT